MIKIWDYSLLYTFYSTIHNIIPPLFYQLYKRKWLNVGFLLLVWLSPLVQWNINTSFWYSLLYNLGIN